MPVFVAAFYFLGNLKRKMLLSYKATGLMEIRRLASYSQMFIVLYTAKFSIWHKLETGNYTK